MSKDLILPFDIVARACQKTKGSVILIGGQAMGVRGYQRVTLDVDFMTTEVVYEKLKPAICTAGYSEVARTHVAAKLRAESENLLDLDFMFVEAETFCGIQKECKTETFQDAEFLVSKSEHLIALKLHAIKQQPSARELKDLNDIVELIKANRLDISSDSFKSLCLKFGTPESYKKILEYAK
jgi:hypothetical protein